MADGTRGQRTPGQHCGCERVTVFSSAAEQIGRSRFAVAVLCLVVIQAPSLGLLRKGRPGTRTPSSSLACIESWVFTSRVRDVLTLIDV